MKIALFFLFFFLGISVGSFINVLVYRVSLEGKRLELKNKKRSFCDSCYRQLKWWENIPLFSFFFLKGKCQTCHSPIPWEYPIVEFFTGITFLILFFNFKSLSFYKISNVFLFISFLLIATLLIIVFLYDFHYQIIPDWAVFILVLLGLLINWHNLVCAFFSAAFLGFLHLITRGQGMGLGDVKFAFFMGLFLGWPKIVVAFYIAFLTGALVGVILILLKKKKFKQRICFGPFLVLSVLMATIFGEKIIRIVYG